jgi:ribosome-binding factor A
MSRFQRSGRRVGGSGTAGRPGGSGLGLRGDPGGGRGSRLQELIREEVDSILRDEVQDPQLQEVRITACELSIDGARARLWYTTPAGTYDPANAAIEAALARASRFVRTRLAETLALKRTPELVFRRDPATHAFDTGAHP